MTKLLIYLVGMVVGSGIMLVIVECRQSTAMVELYSDYNHFTLYEDGSFTGQTIEGIDIEGCILSALCNDNL